MATTRTRRLIISLAIGILLLLIIGAIIYFTRRSFRRTDDHRTIHAPTCPRPIHYAPNYDFDYTQNSREHQNLNSTIDYFRLSLSWSPTFCEGKKNTQDLFQCQHTFGFIVHGLWPSKFRRNDTSHSLRSHPRNCRNEKEIPLTLIEKYFCLMPSEQLMQAEWEKHGTCYWEKPEDYFEQINRLYSKIHLPTLVNEIMNNQTITKRQRRQWIKESFLTLNPSLTSEQIDIMMTNKGRKLKEVDFCYDHQFNHINCN